MVRAYYNENDPFAADWLRMLIVAGLIAEGDVDTRSIEDVTPSDIAGYTQVHLFAGIGGWSYAMRLAGWPDSRPAWSCSCPCQPFSAAGKGGGFADERHLWPAAHWLIAQCRPITVLGEQVASKDGLAWFDTVSADLENTAYSCGAVDICAAGVGAPHIRQRLYWRADSMFQSGQRGTGSILGAETPFDSSRKFDGSLHNRLADDSQAGLEWSADSRYSRVRRTAESRQAETWRALDSPSGCSNSIIPQHSDSADANGRSSVGSEQIVHVDSEHRYSDSPRSIAASGATRGYWAAADWWLGRDGKYRPIEPGVFPLASGVYGRMGKLRGYGNSIVAPLAAEFIKATEGW